MKRILSIILLLLLPLSLQPQGVTRQMQAVVAKQRSAGAPPNITVDFWQTFEFDAPIDATKLAANDNIATGTWDVSGIGLSMSISASGQQAPISTVNTVTDTGTRGVSLDWTLTTASYIFYSWGSAPGASPVSFGFWFKVPTVPSEHVQIIFQIRGSDDPLVSLRMNEQVIQYIGNGAAQNGPTLTADTWYWLTLKVERNASSLFRVYNTSGAQVGSEVSVTAGDFSQVMMLLGSVNSVPGAVVTAYYDNIVADRTDATFPLGP